MSNNYYIFALGFLAQMLFSARLAVQWFKSERAGRVLSPLLFWQLSLVASFLLMSYGILRHDFVIILGQIITYFIYIRNLQLDGYWGRITIIIRCLAILFPFFAFFWVLFSRDYGWENILYNDQISLFMLVWGSLGQIIFSSRFVYQWYYSEKIKQSILPKGFWLLSLVGSSIIISYGIYRRDPVILLGQAFGFVVYSRNLILAQREISFK